MRTSIAKLLILVLTVAFTNCTPRTSQVSSNPSKDLSHIVYEGGSGTSYQDAVVITKARNSSEGVAAEYRYLANRYGARGTAWNLVGQKKVDYQGKDYDIISIKLAGSEQPTSVYFDITSFYGKW
jgi:hypothetical protein